MNWLSSFQTACTSQPWDWTWLPIARSGRTPASGYVIVSKDSDYRQLAFLLGPAPKAVWLRVGNCSTVAIAELLRSSGDVIAQFVASEEAALLVMPDLDI